MIDSMADRVGQRLSQVELWREYVVNANEHRAGIADGLDNQNVEVFS
jgi:hypothetical protein